MIFTTYKGFHFSNQSLHKLLSFFSDKKRMSYHVTFNESAVYIDDTVDRFDVNKLFGFSIGWHHVNSHRFGWNCLDNEIHIYAYSYVDGKRIINEIGVVKINEEHTFTIFINGSKCIFTVIDSQDKIQQTTIISKTRKLFGYKLWPYFGGNNPAPNKITIKLIEN